MHRPQWDNSSVIVQAPGVEAPETWTHRGEGFLVGLAITLAFVAWRLTKK